MNNNPIDEETGIETTGHSWDGIEELNNPLPRWWLWTFYACIVWAIAYTIAFPAWPLISGATSGVAGWSTRGKFRADHPTREYLVGHVVVGYRSEPVRRFCGWGRVSQPLLAMSRLGGCGGRGLSQPAG
jgi:hypothetical protein